MKRIIAAGLIMLTLCGCQSPISMVKSPLQAAAQMERKLDNGENKGVFMGVDIDGIELFQSLESIYPYAFSMELVYYPIGISEISVNMPSKEQQYQAYNLAVQIAKQQTEGLDNKEDKLRVLHDYLVLNCEYDVETAEQHKKSDGTSSAFTAYGALVDGKAVCSGYARAYMMMCNAVGLDVIYISDAEMNHSWNAVMLDGQIYFIDCTFDDPVPDQKGKIIREYFLKTEDELKKTHTWNSDFYRGIITQK